MNTFFNELKRRNVVKAAIAYIVIAWVLLQVASIVLPITNAPEWVLKTFSFFLVIGFPIWVLISWVYEVTPEGLKKTTNVPKDQSITSTTNKRLNILILFGLIAAIVIGIVNRPVFNFNNSISSTDDIAENSIAVLPFDNMSSDKENEWFCDGVTEDILTQLSKIKGLKVISRTSTEKFKNTNQTIPEIAKELGVFYVLEGSVRKQDNTVLITAQLIKKNDEHVWADKYNENLDDVFRIQSDVSKKIVQQLKISISPEEKKQLESIPTENMEAYQYVLQGRSFIDKGGKENGEIAIDFFEKAIELDPNYADAYADLAYAYLGGLEGREKNEEKFKEYSDKALAIDSNSARANSMKGIYFHTIDSIERAKEYFDKAIEVNPNDSRAHNIIAIYYLMKKTQDLEKSLYHINKAHELDPFSREINYFKSAILIENGAFDLAEEHLDKNEQFFSKILKFQLQSGIYQAKGEDFTKEEGDRLITMKILREGIKKYPRNAFLYRFLAKEYDGVLNDDENFVKYAEIAYGLDSITLWPAVAYYNALVESGNVEKALELYHTKTFNDLLNPTRKVQRLFYLHYYQKDYQKAQEYLNDTLISDDYWGKLFNAAYLGERATVDTLLKNQKYSNANKAFLYAILEERDSMYHYLDMENIDPIYINARREVDPYRKEDRYIDFLKKHYFPVPTE
jgi:TolB-like protein